MQNGKDDTEVLEKNWSGLKICEHPVVREGGGCRWPTPLGVRDEEARPWF